MGTIRHIRHTVAFAAASAVVATLLVAPASAAGLGIPVARAAVSTVAEVEAALSAAEEAASAASVRALEAADAAVQARSDADAAAQRSAYLDVPPLAAESGRDAAIARAATVTSTRYRDTAGAALVVELLTSAEPDALLARLALLERIDAVSLRAVASARESADVVEALRAQAATAEAEHARLAAEAETEAARAQAEADAESSAVANAQAELDALYARLAALQRTSVEAAKTARLDQQTAASPSAGGQTSAGGSTGGGSTGGGSFEAPVTSTPVTVPTDTAIMTPAQAQAHARSVLGRYGWGDDQFSCLVSLWNRESGWRVQARNPSSGAYGIPQSYPAEKLASAGADWRTSAPTQIAWGLSYIKGRYGSPCGAWAHSERSGWY